VIAEDLFEGVFVDPLPCSASSLPILPQGEQLPRAICFSALLCSHYKIHLY
jgi:hypothetical protein